MEWMFVDAQDRLVAVVRPVGNGTVKSPRRWWLSWAPRLLHKQDRDYASRLEAVAAVLLECPSAVSMVFNRRGERLR